MYFSGTLIDRNIDRYVEIKIFNVKKRLEIITKALKVRRTNFWTDRQTAIQTERKKTEIVVHREDTPPKIALIINKKIVGRMYISCNVLKSNITLNFQKL